MKIYALYHGDKFIDIGSIEYLAKLLNVSKRTVMFYSSPTYLKRNNGNGYVVIKIDEGGDEDGRIKIHSKSN